MTTLEILAKAKASVQALALLDKDKKNEALLSMAESIEEEAEAILAANAEDIENAKGKISDVMIDRLRLDVNRIKSMADGIRDVVKLPDPTDEIIEEFTRPNGLIIKKIRVPVGVVGIIYESRPNVTSDAAALAFKSGNVCVLRGGKDAFKSSFAIISAMKKGLKKLGISETVINILEDTSRASATELMTANKYVDILIPRGGAGLIRACVENATVPCIQTGTGICHIYVDSEADQDMALDIIENAKTSRPSVCNAVEVCLVNKDIAKEFLPKLRKRLVDERPTNPVELRVDREAMSIINGTPASEADFDTEFLDYILAIKVVDDVNAAIAHISEHSTKHSEAIITSNASTAGVFASSVDSSSVYINASTRFTDGGEFGLGCEIGISTQKLHARGPMGLKELTTYKYVISGNGQIR